MGNSVISLLFRYVCNNFSTTMLTHILPHIALTMAMLVWGTSYIALKIGLSVYTPTQLMALRMTVATCMFLPFAASIWRALKKTDTGVRLPVCFFASHAFISCVKHTHCVILPLLKPV